MTSDDDQWVEIRNCYWLHEAQFVASVLAAEGIEALLPDAHMLGVRPELALALGGARVLVRASDLERARDVLSAVASSESLPPDSDVES
jgi:hypothetical protein